MAQHVGTVTKTSRLPDLPFHAQCDCGTAGSFPEKEQAIQYLRNHGLNVTAHLGNTFKLVDDSDKPEKVPGQPTAHVGGVGNLPASHAPLATEVPAESSVPAEPAPSSEPKGGTDGPPPPPPAPPNATR